MFGYYSSFDQIYPTIEWRIEEGKEEKSALENRVKYLEKESAVIRAALLDNPNK